MSLGQPLIEGTSKQSVSILSLWEFGFEIVDYFASISKEKDSFSSNKNLSSTLNIKNIRHILKHKLKSLGPLLTIRNFSVLRNEKFSSRVQQLA